MRIQCAQCHHHPSDRWGQDDYFALAGFFTGIGRKNFAGSEVVFVQKGIDLKNPRSKISGSTNVEARDTAHLFLLQPKMQDKVRAWVDKSTEWPALARSIAYKWLDEGLIDQTFGDDDMHHGIEQSDIGIRFELQKAMGISTQFGPTRVEHHDLGRAAVAHHPLPHDRVSDARVGADEDEGERPDELGYTSLEIVTCQHCVADLTGPDGRTHAQREISTLAVLLRSQ